MCTRKEDAAAIFAAEPLLALREKAMMGGSAATEVSEEAVKPAGAPFSSVAVMMATPAGWWPKASLNCSEVSARGACAAMVSVMIDPFFCGCV